MAGFTIEYFFWQPPRHAHITQLGFTPVPIVKFFLSSGLFAGVALYEGRNRAVEGPLHFGRKKAARKLSHAGMVFYALAAYALSRARIVGASALLPVLLHLALLHAILLFLFRVKGG